MTEPQWHCYHDRTQDGPLAESVLIRRFGERLVPLHALVWSETWRNDHAWRPAREIDAFRRAATGPVLAPKVPAPLVPAVAAVPRARPVQPPPASFLPPRAAVPPIPLRGPAPRAAVPPGVILPPPGTWERFWARMIDLVVGGNLLLALCVLPFVPDLPNGGVFFVRGMVSPICWMLLETVLIHTFGTTPGKWVFDIQVQTPGGDLPGFWQAARRCASVFVRGLGAGIFPFAIFGMVAAYNRLLTEGQTSWDKAIGLTVVRRGNGWLGWCVLTAGLGVGVWLLVTTWRP